MILKRAEQNGVSMETERLLFKGDSWFIFMRAVTCAISEGCRERQELRGEEAAHTGRRSVGPVRSWAAGSD